MIECFMGLVDKRDVGVFFIVVFCFVRVCVVLVFYFVWCCVFVVGNFNCYVYF